MATKFMATISAVVVLWPTLISTAMAQASCAGWNTSAFFENAAVADIARCIVDGAELDARGKNGWTPLHVAAGINDNPAVITALLDGGAEPDARDENGWTPLHAAAY